MNLTDNEKWDSIKLIEQVDEPRSEETRERYKQVTRFDVDDRSWQLKGWNNIIEVSV